MITALKSTEISQNKEVMLNVKSGIVFQLLKDNFLTEKEAEKLLSKSNNISREVKDVKSSTIL